MKYPVYSSRTVYPEDIECVWEPQNNKGGIYIGNLEASQNLMTLKSTSPLTKSMESGQF